MKRLYVYITLLAFAVVSCTSTGQFSGYVDDAYYWPGDDTPLMQEEVAPKSKSDLFIISEVSKDEDGANRMKNYIYADDEPDLYNKIQAQNIEMLKDTTQDTIYFETDDDETYYVDNYYVDDELSYADRNRIFHDRY